MMVKTSKEFFHIMSGDWRLSGLPFYCRKNLTSNKKFAYQGSLSVRETQGFSGFVLAII